MKAKLSRWIDRIWLAGATWTLIEIVARCIAFDIQQDPLLVAVECLAAGLLVRPVVGTAYELLIKRSPVRGEDDLFWQTIDAARKQGRLLEITPYLDPRIRDSIIRGAQARAVRQNRRTSK